MKLSAAAGTLLVCLTLPGVLGASGGLEKIDTAADCTFQAAADEFLSRQSRARRDPFERSRWRDGLYSDRNHRRAAAGGGVGARNFIDAEIFGKLVSLGVGSAPLSGDEEFVRRIHLDLTGRLPSAGVVRAFLADSSPAKRDELINRLLDSPEFTDRWTLWLGDLLQNTSASTNVSRGVEGRNAFHNWIRQSIAERKSLRDIAWEAIATSGNNYDSRCGAANFMVGALTPMGPVQDTFDMMLVKSATAFLGLAHYDCLLCHDGRGHLDQLSLWGGNSTRMEAQRMAAFFSRTRLVLNRADRSYDVVDMPNGQYDLNTNFGNRPVRFAVGNTRSLTPQYRGTGTAPKDGNWRIAFADFLVQDPMFARNLANRLWKHFFGLGLVDPVETLDPARLDPANPPRPPWTLQASHPALLERLAKELEASWFDLRGFIRLLVQSSAYQLSSRYEAEWKLEYVPLFARHYPRRLEGEEVHDAIAAATGAPGRYTVQGWAEPVEWAVQLPEPAEPRSSGAIANFMNAFLRGNRDSQPRSQSGSILQQLNLMNDQFVLSRVRITASPVLRAVASLGSNEAAVEELFLTFLSRRPTSEERAAALARLGRAANAAARNAALEDLAWTAINRTEFLFSY